MNKRQFEAALAKEGIADRRWTDDLWNLTTMRQRARLTEESLRLVARKSVALPVDRLAAGR
jgi:hypothetical protein